MNKLKQVVLYRDGTVLFAREHATQGSAAVYVCDHWYEDMTDSSLARLENVFNTNRAVIHLRCQFPNITLEV